MKCRYCECTEDNPCFDAYDFPCYWVGPDLCSFCAVLKAAIEDENLVKLKAAIADEPLVEIFSEADATRLIRERRTA